MKNKLLLICVSLMLSCAAANAGSLYAVGTGGTRGEAYSNALARLPSWAIPKYTIFTSAGSFKTINKGSHVEEKGNFVCKITYSSVQK